MFQLRGSQPTKIGVVVVFFFFCYLFMTGVLETNSPSGLDKSEERYAVILDAGSSGSRVHVYKFKQEKNTKALHLISEQFKQLEPGLSSYFNDPVAAANSINPLLEYALEYVPQRSRKDCPVLLRATAGLRMVGKEAGDAILDKVALELKKSSFYFTQDYISIMDGSDEGLYAWVTVNFLTRSLGKDPSYTSGVLDLGGGSTQIAFAITQGEAKLLNYKNVVKKRFGPMVYYLYVHSYLGYGLNEARQRVMKGVLDSGTDECYCVPPKYQLSFRDLIIQGPNEVSNDMVDQCQKAVSTSVFESPSESCPINKYTCSINGVLQPSISDRDFHAFSFYYDRAMDLGMLANPESSPVTPIQYLEMSKKVCGLEEKNILDSFEIKKQYDAAFQCMDHTYIYNLLKNLGFNDHQKLSLTKSIHGVETGWCLGAAIEELVNLS